MSLSEGMKTVFASPGQKPRCPERHCPNRAMNGIEGAYCRDHAGFAKAVERLGKAVDRLGRTLRSTP